MTEPAKVEKCHAWTDVLLARSRTDDLRTASMHILLVATWHWIAFAATLALVDWLLAYGASIREVALLPQSFDGGRVLQNVLNPLFTVFVSTLLLIEGLFSWFTFRLFMRPRGCNFHAFARYWWKCCVWGFLPFVVLSVLFAVFSRHYDAAMSFPMFWVFWGIGGPTLLASIELRRRFPVGRCQKCGYDRTGNVSGRCPECGTAIVDKGPAEGGGGSG